MLTTVSHSSKKTLNHVWTQSVCILPYIPRHCLSNRFFIVSCHNNLVMLRLLGNQFKQHFQRLVVAAFKSYHSMKNRTHHAGRFWILNILAVWFVHLSFVCSQDGWMGSARPSMLASFLSLSIYAPRTSLTPRQKEWSTDRWIASNTRSLDSWWETGQHQSVIQSFIPLLLHLEVILEILGTRLKCSLDRISPSIHIHT